MFKSTTARLCEETIKNLALEHGKRNKGGERTKSCIVDSRKSMEGLESNQDKRADFSWNLLKKNA